MDYKRVENPRPMSRRRSLSPRNSHQGDSYQSQSHNYNPGPKNYQGHGSNDSHYPPMMHYDSSMRRPNEDRPGTPTVSLQNFQQFFSSLCNYLFNVKLIILKFTG